MRQQGESMTEPQSTAHRNNNTTHTPVLLHEPATGTSDAGVINLEQCSPTVLEDMYRQSVAMVYSIARARGMRVRVVVIDK